MEMTPETNTTAGPGTRVRMAFQSPRRRTIQGGAYSGFVSAMKWLLPAGALALIGLVVLWPHLSSNDFGFRIGFTALNLGDSDEPAMINPRYMGSDKDDQIFSITADTARKMSNDDATFELEMPKADIALKDGTWLVLTAETGTYAKNAQTLDLVGAVNLYHDSGYEFRTEKAAIDLESSGASGNVPVSGQGPFGTLNAEGFKLLERGKTIYFTGQAKLVLHPGAGGSLP